nr:MAG TPA: hypothetical protein [Caudoviricetes sp.]
MNSKPRSDSGPRGWERPSGRPSGERTPAAFEAAAGAGRKNR